MPERYNTIVADPPWAYDEGWPIGSHLPKGVEREPGRRTSLQYGSMSVDEIAALPVAEWAARDAHLYLWTTNRYLWDAKTVVEAWGFRFAQLLVWAKTPMGIGPGGTWAQSTEYVLFCRRGSLKSLRRFDSTWFNWKRMGKAHSRKPDAFLDMVEQASPGPYLEMFARRARFGWGYWGNESLGTAEVEAAMTPDSLSEKGKRMRIDLDPKGGGVLIEGTYNELDGLADTIAIALEDGQAEGSLLTDEAVETVTIRRLPGEDEE